MSGSEGMTAVEEKQLRTRLDEVFGYEPFSPNLVRGVLATLDATRAELAQANSKVERLERRLEAVVGAVESVESGRFECVGDAKVALRKALAAAEGEGDGGQ